MKCLIIESQNHRASIVQMTLESQFHFQCELAKNFEDAMKNLLADETVDLLICEDSESITNLFKYLVSVHSTTPIILIKNKDTVTIDAFPDLKYVAVVDPTDLAKSLTEAVTIGIKKGIISPGIQDLDYCKVNTELLLKVVPLEADVYIRLSDHKFVKMFKKGAEFTEEDAQSYLEKKKIKYLYIHKSQSESFIKKLGAALEKAITGIDKGVTLIPSYPDSLHQAIHSLCNQMGFTEPVQQLVKKGVDLGLQSLTEMPTLGKMLTELSKKNKDYISAHSMAVAHVACSLATSMKWPSDITFRKLTYAAFLHDIALPNDRLAKLGNRPDWRKELSSLSEEERKLIINHPTNISTLVIRFKELPPDVDIIIKQHHERPSGKGYPAGLFGDKIAPLSAVFNLAHDLVDYSLDGGDLTSLQDFLIKYEYTKMATTGTYVELLRAIDKEVFERKKSS